ncbi:MAG TPA: asparaginase, partial [Glutamicibacter sp.]|nr:asparaginase [Glutamicibacter sp.]
ITAKLLAEHLGDAAGAALAELASSPALGGGVQVGVLSAL